MEKLGTDVSAAVATATAAAAAESIRSAAVGAPSLAVTGIIEVKSYNMGLKEMIWAYKLEILPIDCDPFIQFLFLYVQFNYILNKLYFFLVKMIFVNLNNIKFEFLCRDDILLHSSYYH